MISKKLVGIIFAACLPLLYLANTSAVAQTTSALSRDTSGQAKPYCLPTGVCLDAAGQSFDVGNMPLAMALSPEGDRLVVSLSGYREQGLRGRRALDGERRAETAADSSLFGTGVFAGRENALRLGRRRRMLSIVTIGGTNRQTSRGASPSPRKTLKKPGTRFPAGLAFSADGRKLYVAENIADSLAVVDVARRAR